MSFHSMFALACCYNAHKYLQPWLLIPDYYCSGMQQNDTWLCILYARVQKAEIMCVIVHLKLSVTAVSYGIFLCLVLLYTNSGHGHSYST